MIKSSYFLNQDTEIMNVLFSDLFSLNQEYREFVAGFPEYIISLLPHPRHWHPLFFPLLNWNTRVRAIRIFKKLPDFFCSHIFFEYESGYYYFCGSHFYRPYHIEPLFRPRPWYPNHPRTAYLYFSIVGFFAHVFHIIFFRCSKNYEWRADIIPLSGTLISGGCTGIFPQYRVFFL